MAPQHSLHRLLSLIAIALVLSTGCDSDTTGSDNGSSTSDAGDAGIGLDLVPTGDTTASDAATGGGDAEVDLSDSIVADSETFGADCLIEGDCGPGELCIGSDPDNDVRGYCTILNCENSAQCASTRDELFCCSNYGEYRGCFRETEGTACGEETGTSGDDCSAGGQSDCAGEENTCIDWYDERLCVGGCRVDGVGGACPEGQWCFPTGGLSGFCAPKGDVEVRETCFDVPGECGEGAICEGYWGEYPSPHSFCSTLCVEDGTCEDNEWCQHFPGQGYGTCKLIGEAEVGDTCTEDRWSCGEDLFCTAGGTRNGRCSAWCQRDTDCGEGFECQGEATTGWGLCGPEGGRGTGAFCGDDPWSCGDGAWCFGGWGNNYNPNAYCTSACDPDGADTCAEGFRCIDWGASGAWCGPDGDVAVGAPCNGPLDCVGNATCVFDSEDSPGQCAQFCGGDSEFADVDCGAGAWCTGVGDDIGVCLATGESQAGDACTDDPTACAEGLICAGDPNSFCLSECTDDPDGCPTGMYCLDGGRNDDARRYCFPEGDIEIGGPCDSSEQCSPGAFCAFTGATGKGICTVNCDDSECPTNFWCLATNTFTFCLPEGSGNTGSDCTEDRFGCVEDTLCLFSDTDDAFCASDCTGFADICSGPETCRYIGWGLNACVPVGDVTVGGSCAANLSVCDEDSLCLNAGTEDAECASICTFDSDACGEDLECYFFTSGVGVCAPSDFDGSALPLGGRPL